jgi:hypothetical protein
MVTVLMVLGGVLAVGLAIFCLISAPQMFIRDIGKNRGPESMRWGIFWSAVALAVLGAVYGFMGSIVLSIATDNLSMSFLPGIIGTTVAFFVVELVIAAYSANDIAEDIRLQKHMAPAVAEYALTRFADIVDVDGGVIKKEHIEAAFEGGNTELLAQLQSHIDDIGHVIGSYTTHGFVMVGSVMVPTTTTHNIYGISKADLQAYPERISAIYSRW